MAAWCRDKLGWTNQTANRLLKTGRRLLDLPVTRDAWVARELSDGQVEIIVDCVTDRRAGLWADHEAEVVPLLAPLDVIQTNRAMQDWAAKADAILDENEPPEEPPAEAMLVKTLDGRGYLKGSFDAEGTEIIATGLRLADSGDLDEPSRKRQGQALVDVFRFYLDHQNEKLGGRHRPHLNVVVNHDDLKDEKPGRTLGGVPFPGSTIRKIACDANIHRVITDGLGSILDYGRSTRTIPPAVYTSLVLRDWGCRFPGCDRPGRVVRRPPRVALGRRRTHQPLEPGAAVLEAPPRHPPARTGASSSNPTAPSRSPTPTATAAPATHPAEPQPPRPGRGGRLSSWR